MDGKKGSSVDQPPAPAYLGLMLGFASLALLAGLIVLILSMGARLGTTAADPQQAELTLTVYPSPSVTWTLENYPSPEASLTHTTYPTPDLTLTPSLTFQPSPTGSQTITPGPARTLAPTSVIPDWQLPATFPPIFTSAPTPTFSMLAQPNWCMPWNIGSRRALVSAVLDGVTIEVELDGETVQVRYIGVQLPAVAPEPGVAISTNTPLPPSSASALLANRRLVEGKWVTLIKERSDTNQQGQLVRYVLADGVFVNHALVRQGFVLAHSYPPDQSCDDFLLEAERLASAAGLGFWAPFPAATRTFVPAPSPQVVIGDLRVVFVDPTGVGWMDANEFVEIRNYASLPLQLGGWTLRDLKGHVFTFPSMLLNSGGYCRIYTNEVHADTCGLSYNSMSAIWDDDDDCAILKDPDGNLIHQFCY